MIPVGPVCGRANPADNLIEPGGRPSGAGNLRSGFSGIAGRACGRVGVASAGCRSGFPARGGRARAGLGAAAAGCPGGASARGGSDPAFAGGAAAGCSARGSDGADGLGAGSYSQPADTISRQTHKQARQDRDIRVVQSTTVFRPRLSSDLGGSGVRRYNCRTNGVLFAKSGDQRERLFGNRALVPTGWRPCRGLHCIGSTPQTVTAKPNCPAVRRSPGGSLVKQSDASGVLCLRECKPVFCGSFILPPGRGLRKRSAPDGRPRRLHLIGQQESRSLPADRCPDNKAPD